MCFNAIKGQFLQTGLIFYTITKTWRHHTPQRVQPFSCISAQYVFMSLIGTEPSLPCFCLRGSQGFWSHCKGKKNDQCSQVNVRDISAIVYLTLFTTDTQYVWICVYVSSLSFVGFVQYSVSLFHSQRRLCLTMCEFMCMFVKKYRTDLHGNFNPAWSLTHFKSHFILEVNQLRMWIQDIFKELFNVGKLLMFLLRTSNIFRNQL